MGNVLGCNPKNDDSSWLRIRDCIRNVKIKSTCCIKGNITVVHEANVQNVKNYEKKIVP